MLRAALIVALALATPASGDLWTTRSASEAGRSGPESSAPGGSGPISSPHVGVPGLSPGPAATQHVRWTLTAVVDPACPVAGALVRDVAAFARAHPDVTAQVFLAAPPQRAPEGGRALVALAQAGVALTWSPATVRQLARSALPAVSVYDDADRGVRATGRPPLDLLWRAAQEQAR